MSRVYHTLVSREKCPFGKWSIEFGDYDRSVVKAEMEDLVYQNKFLPKREKREYHMLKSGDTQVEINEKVVDFNSEIPEKVEA